jgi:hypothetical protein
MKTLIVALALLLGFSRAEAQASFATIAALQGATIATPPATITVGGYYNPADGGGGIIYISCR